MNQDPNTNPLFDSAHEWIQNFEEGQAGATFAWGKEQIREFKNTSIDTLLRDPYFLNLDGVMYDSVYNDICELWEERKNREVNTAVFLEAIGSGKSFKASILLWLLWFELCMYESPQRHFNLAERSVIAVMLLSRSETQSRRVVFQYAWDRFQSGFNKDYFPANPRLSREIRIERNRTCVYAGTSSALSALGYNVYAASIDEADFLEVTEDSKKSYDDKYDAGIEMYNAVMNRMSSRFMIHGVIPGIIIIMTSPATPDAFAETKIKEIISLGPEISKGFWRRRSLWEAKGKKFFNLNSWFEVDLETLDILKEVNNAKRSLLDL